MPKKNSVVATPETATEVQKAMTDNQVAAAVPPAAKPPEPPKKKAPRIEHIRVRHDFDNTELLALGQTMADKKRVYDSTKAELKTITRQFNTTLSGLDCDITDAVNKIKDGFEMREVEAVIMVKLDNKKKTATKCYYRRDTGAFIKDEKAINTELELFNVLPPKHDHKKPLDLKTIAGVI